MYIQRLRLQNFRNYNFLDIELDKNINVFYGNNGQGKTNIIEAISLTATGKSFRSAKDSEMIHFNHSKFSILVNAMINGDAISIEITYDQQIGKMIQVNEIPVKKYADLVGNVKTVTFSPDDLNIIKEGPSERRKFIDSSLSQLKPTYLKELQNMNKLLSQKSFLLKSNKDYKVKVNELDVWNQSLAKNFTYIITERYKFINSVKKYAKQRCSEISGLQEVLNLSYVTMVDIDENTKKQNLEDEIYDIINRSINEEIKRGTVLVGPQRDDIKVFINEMDVKSFGSQGQQRTAALSLKLAEMDIIRTEFEVMPILLLDDVMSELDENRRNYLMKSIDNSQVIITCNDKESIQIQDKNIKYMKVERGEVECFYT